MSNQWIEAGALIRGSLRRELAKAGIQFTETKSLLSSVFILHCTPEVYANVVTALRRQGFTT